jgi:two-component system, OmpR family, response regulator
MPTLVSTHPATESRAARAHTLRPVSREPRHPIRPATAAPAPASIAVSVTVHLAPEGAGSPALAAVLAALERLAAHGDLTVVTPPTPARDAETSRGHEPTTDTVRVDARSRIVSRDGQEIALTRLEFDLLEHLLRHPRRVFSRAQLLNAVWGNAFTGTRTVDVHVRRLRQKLDIPSLVSTVRGVGYRLGTHAPVALVASGEAAA